MQNPFRTLGTRSLLRLVAGALALSVVAGLTLTHATVPMPHGDGIDGHTGVFGLGSTLAGVAWLALVVAIPGVLAYWLTTRPRTDGDHALEHLREQYARGDLSDEEFDHRRARLDGER